MTRRGGSVFFRARMAGTALCLLGFWLIWGLGVGAYAGDDSNLWVQSPDGHIRVTLHAQGPLAYSILYDKKALVERSRLGLQFQDGLQLGADVECVNSVVQSQDTVWEDPFGRNRLVRDCYNEQIFHLKSRDGKGPEFGLVVRVYDEGVGIRYLLPNNPEEFTLTEDQTEFRFAELKRAWPGREKGFSTDWQYIYRETPAEKLLPGAFMGLPLLVETPAAYALVHEADVSDWAGMFICTDGRVLTSTDALKGGDVPQSLDLDVTGLDSIVLDTDSEGETAFDHTTWADACLTKEDGTKVALSSLKLEGTQGWGTLQMNQSVDKKPIRLGKKEFASGLGTHAPSQIVVPLGKAYTRLTATVGIEDETEGKGKASFSVIASTGAAPVFQVMLSPRLDGKGVVVSRGPRMSPWRLIMVSKNPGDFICSNLVKNLSRPSTIEDISWIKPGVTTWDWLAAVGNGQRAGDTELNRECVKFAQEMGFRYHLVDDGWYRGGSGKITTPDGVVDLKTIQKETKKRKVGLWLWLNWSDLDKYGIEKAMEEFREWGIKGLKIDFMSRYDQEMVCWVERVLKAAAQNKILINFHGMYLPNGLARTYPNFITQEGIAGIEENLIGDGRITPSFQVTQVFTRMAIGAGDLTPGWMNVVAPDKFKAQRPLLTQGTRAHQLAQLIAYESPLLCLSDTPAHYREAPECLWFLKSVPTVWDETRVPLGEIGRYVAVLRRSGKDWWLGVLNDETARTLKLPLSFLGDGTFEAHSSGDSPESAEDPKRMVEATRSVTSQDTFEIPLAPGGGMVARFSIK